MDLWVDVALPPLEERGVPPQGPDAPLPSQAQAAASVLGVHSVMHICCSQLNLPETEALDLGCFFLAYHRKAARNLRKHPASLSV